MAYVIVGTCVNDGACVDVCPVDCIHPTPDEPGFKTADMLYIDPIVCVHCNACAEACPIGAILPEDQLPPHLQRYREINAELALSRRS
jgi:NAD-dependent dihydropyrimidine dehydrogenase PreA subunit